MAFFSKVHEIIAEAIMRPVTDEERKLACNTYNGETDIGLCFRDKYQSFDFDIGSDQVAMPDFVNMSILTNFPNIVTITLKNMDDVHQCI